MLHNSANIVFNLSVNVNIIKDHDTWTWSSNGI